MGVQSQGCFCLLLHAHLPFVRHPEDDDFLEERWFYEAMTECYLPLVQIMEGWLRDDVDFRIAMTITPPLAAMLNDELLNVRFAKYLDRLIALAEREMDRTRAMPEFHPTAKMYHARFLECRKTYAERWGGRLLRAFREIAATGKLEIIGCSATHGFLPLLNIQPEIVRAQVAVGAQSHRELIGSSPRGMWNAECGYYPGLDAVLAREGVEYFFTDTHGILYADQRPNYGVFAPVRCPSGVVAMGRDPETSRAVWSAEQGYPGDNRYREFYRDIGFDLDPEQLGECLPKSGVRVSTGIKYHRVTGRGTALAAKKPYDPEAASRVATLHAQNFAFNRRQQAEYLGVIMSPKAPVIFTPYDAELFGHWWYEGPMFLDRMMRTLCEGDRSNAAVVPTTPSECIERAGALQTTTPAYSSWGEQGFAGVWVEPANDWIYRPLHRAGEAMIALAGEHANTSDPLVRRALNQMGRELLLAQSSDWAFIMKTGTTVEYAVRRTRGHLQAVADLSAQVRIGRIESEALATLEGTNNIFSTLQFEVFGPDPPSGA